MSQERTRFPIQPSDRRRTARSSRDVRAVPDESAQDDERPQDKPDVPPHERHRDEGPASDVREDDADQPDGGQGEAAG